MGRRAFVISPIGQPGSDVREHADDVFRFIIEPAMRECDVEPVRSDHLHEPGKISSQMFREILDDDLSIAVLTGHNPNVYYELAIAQAANRPVILLAEEGTVLPFDVSDLRVVLYTMRPTPLFDGVYKDLVVKQVREVEAAGWKAKPPFGDGLTAREGFSFFRKARDWGSARAWEGLLEHTETTFEVMGLGLTGWNNSYTRKTLVEKAEAGCVIRMLITDPENPVLPQSINASVEGRGLDIVRMEIDETFNVFSDLARRSDNIQVRKITRGCPHMQVARTDSSAVCIPYLFSDGPHDSPLIRCAADHPLYRAVELEFESLWEANEPLAVAPEPADAEERGAAG